MSLIQRLRATAALGLTWSIPWALTGVAFITWRVFLGQPRLAFPLHYWPRFALTSGLLFAGMGFVAGALFAFTLGKTARGRTVDDLSLSFAARWGAVAGAASIAAVPLMGFVPWPVLVVGGAIFAIVGAGSAVATLSVARRPVAHGAIPPTSRSD